MSPPAKSMWLGAMALSSPAVICGLSSDRPRSAVSRSCKPVSRPESAPHGERARSTIVSTGRCRMLASMLRHVPPAGSSAQTERDARGYLCSPRGASPAGSALAAPPSRHSASISSSRAKYLRGIRARARSGYRMIGWLTAAAAAQG
jgi:hypothetical protein